MVDLGIQNYLQDWQMKNRHQETSFPVRVEKVQLHRL